MNTLPAEIATVARQCILDCVGAAVAGAAHPSVEAVFGAVAPASTPADGPATVIGRHARLGALDAALVNGTAAHVLEVDDSIVRMQAHSSAVLVPALLALAEARDLPGDRLIAGLVEGVEEGCRLGDDLNPGHYAAGWHASATLGTLAAAAACAAALELDPERRRAALGYAAVQAGGLKGAFGSAAKPFQVGRASSSGLLAALLAERGAVLPARVLEGPDGFADVYAGEGRRASQPPAEPFAIRSVLFKRHASCHGTHAPLEAIAAVRAASTVQVERVRKLSIEVPEQHRRVCGIEDPGDGGALRFSLTGVASMALLGLDTGDPASYSDAVAHDPQRRELARRVEVRYVGADPGFGGWARVELTDVDGAVFAADADITAPAADLARQGRELRAKFDRLTTPVLGAERASELAEAIEHLGPAARARDLLDLCRPPDGVHFG